MCEGSVEGGPEKKKGNGGVKEQHPSSFGRDNDNSIFVIDIAEEVWAEGFFQIWGSFKVLASDVNILVNNGFATKQKVISLIYFT